MINKKNLLGKTPDELGDKDAIHVAIVSVRAGSSIKPGQKCGLNKDREAVADSKGVGVADPFRKKTILRGESFWLLLNQDAVPNVRHEWEHPDVDFSAPTVEVKKNSVIQEAADVFGVTYEQVMAACAHVVEHDEPAVYPGTKGTLPEDGEDFEKDDVFSEWADETLYEFENQGSACCPEYSYPDCDLFELAPKPTPVNEATTESK
jgi:hypothetical protein